MSKNVCSFECKNLTYVLKTDISAHFPIFTISMKHRLDSSNKIVTLRKRVINADSIKKNLEIFYLKWIGGTCIQYLTPTMPKKIPGKFYQVYNSLSKLSLLKEKLYKILG